MKTPKFDINEKVYINYYGLSVNGMICTIEKRYYANEFGYSYRFNEHGYSLSEKYLEAEVWKDIKEYEGLYQISNFGSVRRLKQVDSIGRFIKEKIIINGNKNTIYNKRVNLSKDNKRKKIKTYKLIIEHFSLTDNIIAWQANPKSSTLQNK